VAVVLAEKRSHAAGGVPALRAVLDLDHLGPEVGEVQRAKRRGPEVLESQDPVAGRGQRHAGFLSTSWREMMTRCISFVPSPMHMSGASR